MSGHSVIQVEHLSKEYRLGTINHGTLRRDLQSWWARVRGKPDPNALIREEDDGRGSNARRRTIPRVGRRIVRSAGGRAIRHHRQERRREVDAAEDPLPGHRAERRVREDPRPDRQPARSRHRLSPGAHGTGEHLPQRRDPRNDPRGDPAQIRRHRRFFPARAVHRHAGEALFLWHVRQAGFLGCRPPGRRGADRRRSAGRGRLRVPAKVPRQAARRDRERPHRAARLAQHDGGAESLHAGDPAAARPLGRRRRNLQSGGVVHFPAQRGPRGAFARPAAGPERQRHLPLRRRPRRGRAACRRTASEPVPTR